MHNESSALLLGKIHARRVRVALYAGGSLLIFMGLSWGLFFITQRLWLMIGIDVLMFVVGLTCLWLTKHNFTRSASFLMLISLFFMLCGMNVFLDIPNSVAPRSLHNFLLFFALYAHFILQGENKWVKYGVPLIFLAAFLVFASSNAGIVTNYVISDQIRIGGTWFNNVIAIIILCMMLYIMQADLSKQNKISRDISVALLDHQFVLYYQPVVDNQGIVFGAEALLRWNHPVRGLVSPSEFIPLAEQSGLIVPLGRWVLHSASQQLALWAKNPLTAHFTLAVNVSTQQFHEVDFVTHVLSSIKKTGANTSKLKIEITESVLIHDMEDVVAKMNELKSAGIGFSLDDFGTGFSSLNYLKRLPLDQIKIDQSFVRDILFKPKDAMIARTIISLGHDLGLVVIAEGVENKNQRDFLIENGCFSFQGFMFSEPLPVKEFERFAKVSLD